MERSLLNAIENFGTMKFYNARTKLAKLLQRYLFDSKIEFLLRLTCYPIDQSSCSILDHMILFALRIFLLLVNKNI